MRPIRPQLNKNSSGRCGLIFSIVVRASDCFAAKAASTLFHAVRSTNLSI